MALTSYAQAEIGQHFDKFTGLTTTTAKRNSSIGSNQVIFSATFEGVQPSAPPAQIQMMFILTSQTWHFLSCYDVHLLADGKPVRVLSSARSGQVGRGFVVEGIQATVSWDEAKKMAAAKVIEAEICTTEIGLDYHDIEDIQAVMSASTPSQPETPPEPKQ
jgi:hypothetical protein